MRVNLPVTSQLYRFPADQTLVSVTDLKGRITYCNPAFVEVSGFAREELLGQPHNIVRHPDMPEEAFRDMWATIQSGLPWTGLVKNRRKNGDHYWVCANATPMRDGDRIVGFLSVRTTAQDDAVRDAEALYASMREEAQQGRQRLGLDRGVVVRRDLGGRLVSALRPGLRSALAAVSAAGATVCAASVQIFGDWGWLVAPASVAASTWALWRISITPLRTGIAQAQRLAAGDLASPIAVDATGPAGELQRALMQLSVNLRTVVADTRQQIDNLRVAAAEIAAGNQDLSQRTESQAASLQQTAASMEQIKATASNSAGSTALGVQQASRTTQAAVGGDSSVRAVAEAMSAISASSRRIEDIVGTVEGVAFQTNLLALNAAVEAARAGPQGRGFAVVAGEVRALAQRSTKAAAEIRKLIQESTERVGEGAGRTDQALQRISEVRVEVDAMRATLDGIDQAAAEQRSGVSQITEAVTHLDGITQQNAAMVEELAAAAASLNTQVAEVDQSMRLFRLRAGDRTVAELDAVEMRRSHREAAAAETA